MTEKIKKPYKRKVQCKSCKCRTDSPAWAETKLVCQKCARYYRVFKKFPPKQYIKKLKEDGLWKL